MKKLFVCAMALASVVACSKDDVAQEPVLDSVNKSIAITIANGSAATRGDAGHTTAATGTSQIAVADADDLTIFFATTDGTILEYKKLVGTAGNHSDSAATPEYTYGTAPEADPTGAAVNGDYIFHNVPAAITKVAIARYEDGDITITKGTTKLEAVEALASNAVKNEQREIDDICLYGDGTLGAKGDMCVKYNGVEYYVYPVSVTVTPKLARLEINNIECLDLGEANDDLTDGKPNINTFGIDKLQLLSLGWGGTTTTGEGEAATTSYIYNIPAADFNNVVLHGTYKAGATTAANANDDVEGDNAYQCPTSKKVWSWNVPTTAAVPSDSTPMVLGLKASAYDYTLAEDDLKLVVNGLKDGNSTLNAFSAANIYQLNLQFDEGDIAGQEGVCVNVTVTINPWTVKTVTPSFSK